MEYIRRGRTGPEVEDVQRRLENLGFACPDDRGIFDEATEAAVRAFQQVRGLPSDGIVGEDTWRTLVGASVRLGDRMLYVTRPLLHGDDVRELQRRLSRLGFDSGYDDGLYGRQTFDAVREFQLNIGITVDGIAGPTTIDGLTRLHRQHQAAPAYAVREREQLRRAPRQSLAGARIMVDPGRGPDDPGATGPDGVREATLTWQIASVVEGQLAALGAHVVLSRGPGTSPAPSDRAEHANLEDAEVILSVHMNEDPSPLARGVAGYHFGTDGFVSDRGRALAELAVDRVVEVTGTAHCRVHASALALLQRSRAPAVVIEVGFLSHPEEGVLLTDPAYQRLVAAALVDATVTFLLGRSTAPEHHAPVPASSDGSPATIL
ncbi:MAG: N-acetylmuramoyl-L-alanine amidase [Nitriliruptor sp.]|nr:MAG: N-acetylmuramoyl-L-alanine amidase [Nitriliruptor sp.]